MKLSLFFAAAACIVTAPTVLGARLYEKEFNEWMKEHNIKYEGTEYHKRLAIFSAAEDKIKAHNADPKATFSMGHNAFSALTWDEFRAQKGLGRSMLTFNNLQKVIDVKMKMKKAEIARMLNGNVVHEDLPKYKNWVEDGAVTDVKDQKQCGSCWSFSVTGAMEGALYVKSGELHSLSEQELVDCDDEDQGCNGGLMDLSFDWIKEHNGLCAEDDYPYTAADGSCQTSCEPVKGTKVVGWVDVEPNEEALMAAVVTQPVSVAIEADEMAFQLYNGGVLSTGCGHNLDHGVLLVGYGHDDETDLDYWLVKNSWGGSWGDHGFIKLMRDTDENGGVCGILLQASYPVLSSREDDDKEAAKGKLALKEEEDDDSADSDDSEDEETPVKVAKISLRSSP